MAFVFRFALFQDVTADTKSDVGKVVKQCGRGG
jgi:hypothetical protein